MKNKFYNIFIISKYSKVLFFVLNISFITVTVARSETQIPLKDYLEENIEDFRNRDEEKIHYFMARCSTVYKFMVDYSDVLKMKNSQLDDFSSAYEIFFTEAIKIILPIHKSQQKAEEVTKNRIKSIYDLYKLNDLNDPSKNPNPTNSDIFYDLKECNKYVRI